MIQIPTVSDMFYTQITTLDGTDYLLEFRFNTRENCWYLIVSLADSTQLAGGIKLVSNFPLLQKYADSRMPPGELLVLAPSSDASPPGRFDLGTGLRCQLVYLTKAEVPAGIDAERA